VKNPKQQEDNEHEAWEQEGRATGTGNGREREADQPVARVYEQSRRVREDVEGLLSAIFEAKADVESALRERLAERPYVGLAAAAGLGYVLGAGISPRLIRTAVGLGGRVAFAVVMRQLAAPLTEAIVGRTA
jgi:ElaB/YqjD/DUF883 family membrane-anchored ribosome-binding protein